jgi:CheY-like chemotaxis protein
MSNTTAIFKMDLGEACPPMAMAPNSNIHPNAGKTVLIAYNDALHRALIADMLVGQGYLIVLASDGEEALARMESGGIDLLVAAISMPRMGGLELLQAMRDLDATPQTVLIAAGMTEMDAVYLKAAGAMGAARGHAWPLTPSVFLSDIRDLLQRKPSL